MYHIVFNSQGHEIIVLTGNVCATCFASLLTGPVGTRGWLLSVAFPMPIESPVAAKLLSACRSTVFTMVKAFHQRVCARIPDVKRQSEVYPAATS